MPSKPDRWTLPLPELQALAKEHQAGATLESLAPRYGISRHTLGHALRAAGLTGYYRTCKLPGCGVVFHTQHRLQRYCCPGHAEEAERKRLLRKAGSVRGPRLKKKATKERPCMRCGRTIMTHLDKHGRCMEHFCKRCDERRRFEMSHVEAWG